MNFAAAAFFMMVFYYYYFKLKARTKSSIKGKIAIITGASSGIGEACAKQFHKDGCNIIIAARNVEKLKELQAYLLSVDNTVKVTVHDVDIGNTASVAKFVNFINKKHPHGIDILVNNAGISYRGRIETTDLQVHKDVMNVNYFGQIDIVQQLLPTMIHGERDRKYKRFITCVSSVQGKMSIPFRSAYSASKHACQSFYDCLRSEVGKYNINVSVLSPGYVRTNISSNAKLGDGSTNTKKEDRKDSMSPEEVALRVVEMIECHEKDVVLDCLKHKLVILIRFLLPNLYFWIMEYRAKNNVGL